MDDDDDDDGCAYNDNTDINNQEWIELDVFFVQQWMFSYISTQN